MKYSGLFVALFVVLLLSVASISAAADYKPGESMLLAKDDTKAEKASPEQTKESPGNAMCSRPEGEQECCSAKDCEGKRLSQRDQHNCKVKSTGKSWWSGSECINL